MNCESCEEPKNSRTAAAAGLALIRSCGMTVSMSTEDMRSLMARSMRRRPRRYWFSMSSPTERTRRLPRWSMSSISPLPSRRSTSALARPRRCPPGAACARCPRRRGRGACSSSRGRRPRGRSAPDRRTASGTSPRRYRASAARRDASRGRCRTAPPRATTFLSTAERVADVGADIDVVDVEHRDLVEPPHRERLQDLLGDLVAGLGIDLAGLRS